MNIVFALAALLIIGVTAAVSFVAGHDYGCKGGYRRGHEAGWKQHQFDAAMDAANPDTTYFDLYETGVDHYTPRHAAVTRPDLPVIGVAS